MSYPLWCDPLAVNLPGVELPPVFDGGYYLFSAPNTGGQRVGVVLAVREQNRIDYARTHPPNWRTALAAFLQ